MKVFISWSGGLSHKVACSIRDWLPSVLQYVKPYVSSEDIDKGARWSTDIAGELQESTYGILCITMDNLHAPWINFEAGALSKSVDKSRVSPFLVDIKRTEVEGPLLQFQSTVFEKTDVEKLLTSINNASAITERIPQERLAKAVDVWWQQLEDSITAAKKEFESAANATATSLAHPPKPVVLEEKVVRMIEETLELSRIQQKLLTDQHKSIGPESIAAMLRSAAVQNAVLSANTEAIFDHPSWYEFAEAVKRIRNTNEKEKKLVDPAYEQLYMICEYLVDRFVIRPNRGRRSREIGQS